MSLKPQLNKFLLLSSSAGSFVELAMFINVPELYLMNVHLSSQMSAHCVKRQL